jgi:chemotaxis family two-component system response regulator PixG
MSSSISLFEVFESLKNRQYTGCLGIESELEKRTWIIYFYLGKLIWTDGGTHPNRCWQRHLIQYLSYIEIDKIEIRGADRFECINYHILLILLQRKIIDLELLEKIIRSKISETLFDIIQIQDKQPFQYHYESESADLITRLVINISIVKIPIEEAIDRVQSDWSEWTENGFQSISPNLVPQLENLEQIQQEMSSVSYSNLIQLFDGKSTIRDISLKMNKSNLQVAIAITPFLRKKLCTLVEVPDREEIDTENVDRNTNTIQRSVSIPVVACIDDSPEIAVTLKEIVTKLGYSFLYIQDPLQVIPELIDGNANLIFLDVNTPIINGYEICSQIRRVPKLKNIPVVMLTGKDNTLDRLKGKLVKASDFISKPLKTDMVLSAIEKFLSQTQIDRNLLYERRK